VASSPNADVAIIGAGFIGLSCAYFLAGRGISVVVLERNLPGAGSLVLELDLVSQDVKLPFIGSKEEVPDPPQPQVDAKSFFELSPSKAR
jgi:flavin-dependent dehydrogenase